MFYKVTHGRYVSLVLGGLGIYVLWMDVGFYLELQNLPVRQENISSVYTYSPIQMCAKNLRNSLIDELPNRKFKKNFRILGETNMIWCVTGKGKYEYGSVGPSAK